MNYFQTLSLALGLFFFAIFGTYSQESQSTSINTEVSAVTVYQSNAQITRTKTISLAKGTQSLKFEDLSPFVIGNSVQVKTNKDLTILGVNFTKDFSEDSKKPEKLTSLEEKVYALNNQIEGLEADNQILSKEISFLDANRSIAGSSGISATKLNETVTFYRNRLKAIEKERATNKEKYDPYR